VTLPPPMTPPPPPLWAPRLRARLNRLFRWLDRRKARAQRAGAIMQADLRWRDDYADWWNDHGWRQGAPTPDQAWQHLQAQRRPR
jgi:hypothetical protein